MFIGTVTFFVYQFQKGGSTNKNKNTNTVVNRNRNTNATTNANTNTNPAVDLNPIVPVPDNWKYYTNPTVNYSLRYPANWTLQEVTVPDHPTQKIPVRYIRLANPAGDVALHLGVRRVGDVFGIGERTGAPSGTLKPGPKITIGTTVIQTNILIVGDKATALFYHPVQPFGFTYVEGREVQAELDIMSAPGVSKPITDLQVTADAQVANTIFSTLGFTGEVPSLIPPPPSAPPLGEYRVETYRLNSQAKPDTRLVNFDGGKRTVIIDSTRSRANLVEGHGFMPFALPAFGTILFLQDQELKTGAPGGAIWTYDVKTKALLKQSSYPPLGWGRVMLNTSRTRAVYVSSVDREDSGDIKILYYVDLVNNTLSTLVTLRDNQTLSSGWGGTTNTFVIAWVNDETARYSFYDQTSGNKQTKAVKTKLGDGQIVVPGANPATQKTTPTP